MCGIAGFADSATPPDLRLLAVERMCAALRHRGPDDEGTISRGPVTLGMRRLAIFDPAHGRQPMSTSDGRFHLIFNGAIYNFRSLRSELEQCGHRFHTECDTEVLLAAYAQWGDGCLKRLRGMFAFAVWDTREETLFLARDPFGIKPLYYSKSGSSFVFASELRALLACGRCSSEVDPRAVSESLAYLAAPAPRTFYRNAQSLRPGESALWRSGQLLTRQYWSFRDLAHSVAPPCASREQFIVELRERLENTIEAHSLADVPVGAFLSGGLDSNVIVGLMSRRQRTPLKTFSIGFDEVSYSEAAEAASAAAHFGTEHHAFVLTGERVARDIEGIIDALDQPTGDAINSYYVCQCAREGGVTVALSGLGGDELFGGYPWFTTTPRLARLLPAWRVVPRPLRSAIVSCLQGGDTRREKLGDLLAHATNFHELAALQRRNFAEPARQSLLRQPTRFETHQELSNLPQELSGVDSFSSISAWELRTYMADVLLRDSDVVSMRHSLELRVPFLDQPLIEWLWRQPARFKYRAGRPKAALADAVRDILPPGVADRRKRGFTLPFALWMRGPLRPFLDETLSASSVERSGFFNTAAVQGRWRTFLEQNDPREWSRIWSLAVLIAFLNRRQLVAA